MFAVCIDSTDVLNPVCLKQTSKSLQAVMMQLWFTSASGLSSFLFSVLKHFPSTVTFSREWRRKKNEIKVIQCFGATMCMPEVSSYRKGKPAFPKEKFGGYLLDFTIYFKSPYFHNT